MAQPALDTLSIHLTLDLYRCDSEALDSLDRVRRTISDAAEVCGMTPSGEVFHRFDPSGVTGVLAGSAANICVHTWPEHGYAAVDIFSGRPSDDLRRAAWAIVEGLRSADPRIGEMRRGVGEGAGRVGVMRKKPSGCQRD